MGTSRRSARAAGLVLACLAASSIASSPAAARPACDPNVRRVAAGTWETRPIDGIRGAPFTWRMTADAKDPRLVVVADNEGILVTRDGGCTWARTLDYVDFLAPSTGSPIDAVVAGSAGNRSLHVLVAPWTPFVPAKLFSSFDDGAAWTAADAPGIANLASLSLAASPAVPGRVHLLVDQLVGGSVYATNGDGEWRLRSVLSLGETPCTGGPACIARPLRALRADPFGDDLWGSSYGATDRDEALAYSSDAAATWEYRSVPEMSGGVSQMVVTPVAIVIAGTFWDYAMSRDGGLSWSVGRYPKLTSSQSTHTDVFEIAYFDRGRGIALLPGEGPTVGWAGNVLVFDGRRWTNAAPPEFAGYDRTDADGDGLSFAALASTEGPLLALSSRGDLMGFRRR